MTEKHQILETITAVARLITLVFKPHNTKISIREHNVVLCEPKYDKYYGINFSQGIQRYLHGDSREDIYILNHVIINFIEWYIIPYKTKDKVIYNGLLNMAKYLCIAFKKLQSIYKTGNVVGTLQYYIIILTSVIDDTFNSELLYTNTTSSRNSFLDDNKLDDELIYSTIFDIEKFRNFWTRDELYSICVQFEKCFKQPDEDDYTLFTNIDAKQNVEQIENNINTLPVPRCKHNAIVSGHLVGISNILDTMDKKFRIMLNQSVKGSN